MAVVEQHNKASRPIEDDQPIIYTQVNKDTSLGTYCYVAPPVPEKNKDVPSEYCVAMATGGNRDAEEPRVTSEYCEVSHHDQVPSDTEQSASSALSANPSVPTQDGGPNEPAQQVVSEYSTIQPVAGDSVPQQPVSSSSSQPGLYDRLQHNLGTTSNTGSTTHDMASQYESLHRHGNGNTTTLSKGQLPHIM